MEKKEKIYTHDESAKILELFEDLLIEHNIKVPSPEDDEREDDNEAALYGTTYGDLLYEVECKLVEMLEKAGVSEKQYVQGIFSGTF